MLNGKVAVTGIPEPQRDHAIIMARFARACMNEMARLTRYVLLSTVVTGLLEMRITSDPTVHSVI